MFKKRIGDLSFFKWVSFKKVLLALIIVLAILGILAAAYYYRQYRALKANPNIEAEKEVGNIVATVGKLMELPSDETPTVATISDIEKLKDQAFFQKAENGDKLLAYAKAMQVILYRPATNKIINVSPIILNQQTETPPAIVALKVAYYNGSQTPGLARQAETKIKAAYPNYQTATLIEAVKKDYNDNLIIDLTGTNSTVANDLAVLLNGKVVSMPADEKRPDADILVISGK